MQLTVLYFSFLLAILLQFGDVEGRIFGERNGLEENLGQTTATEPSKSNLYRILRQINSPYLKRSDKMEEKRMPSYGVQRRGPLCFFTSLPCPDYNQIDSSNAFVQY